MTAARPQSRGVGNPGPAALVELTHHRWALPILASLHTRDGGAKFITLLKALALPRDSLARTLAALIDLGLVQRNPGYGHPMRPEYLLTNPGSRLAAAADDLLQRVAAGQQKLLLKKWSLPVIAAIDTGAARFADIRRTLPDVTPRALTSTLKQLADQSLVERTVWDDSPPTVEYRLTSGSRPIADCLSPLCNAIVRLLAD